MQGHVKCEVWHINIRLSLIRNEEIISTVKGHDSPNYQLFLRIKH